MNSFLILCFKRPTTGYLPAVRYLSADLAPPTTLDDDVATLWASNVVVVETRARVLVCSEDVEASIYKSSEAVVFWRIHQRRQRPKTLHVHNGW